MKNVRVRFAPSPTGALHIGGLRTALYNYLFARQHHGTMILRIEDTDQNRYVPGAEEYIIKSLQWAGIQLDEGVSKGGPFAPYRQSERKSIYQQYTQQLVSSGHAYYAFDTDAELESMRERLKVQGALNQQYDSITRYHMKNSLTLSTAETQQKLNAREPVVIRLKVEPNQEIKLIDLIRGEVTVNSSQIDDKVLLKSDGMPTYHLANVVDDYLMKITHVIRGEEWLPSAPLHLLLYRLLGWENETPKFAHLPLLLKPDGNGKLSKRDADRMGFPIFPLNWEDPSTRELAIGYKESGYLPEALINFLAFLGWNPGTNQEIFSMDELVNEFTIERIGKAGAKFDIQKAQWYNQHYLRAKNNIELASYLITDAEQQHFSCTKEKAEKIVSLLRDRITFPQQLLEQGIFFFVAPTVFDQSIIQKKWSVEIEKLMLTFYDEIIKCLPLSASSANHILDKTTAIHGIKPGQVLQLLRLIITGQSSGPDLMTSLEILGPVEVSNRIKYAIKKFNSTLITHS